MTNCKDKFFSQLPVSERTKVNYKYALNGSFIRSVLREKCETEDIFSITSLTKLWEVYSYINIQDANIMNHRIYSAAIMRYIRFLNNGKKIGRRIDANKPRKIVVETM